MNWKDFRSRCFLIARVERSGGRQPPIGCPPYREWSEAKTKWWISSSTSDRPTFEAAFPNGSRDGRDFAIRVVEVRREADKIPCSCRNSKETQTRLPYQTKTSLDGSSETASAFRNQQPQSQKDLGSLDSPSPCSFVPPTRSGEGCPFACPKPLLLPATVNLRPLLGGACPIGFPGMKILFETK
jgi:hypothetical protein